MPAEFFSKAEHDSILSKLSKVKLQVRERILSDLNYYMSLQYDDYCYGDCHVTLRKKVNDKFDRARDEGEVFNLLILYPRGHLKALRLDQKVITPKGWVRIGDLIKGDYVYGQDGLPKKVLELHPISTMELYEVTTRTGRKVVCNEEHLWNVICPSNTKGKVTTKPLKEIIKNYKSFRFDKRSGKYYTEYRYFLPNISPVQLPERELLIDPYTLGAWLGDGTSSQGAMTSADPEIMEYINQHYEVTKRKSKYGYGVLGLRGDLVKLGLLNNKHIPEEYLLGSVDQRLALLQGLMDTDGTVMSSGNMSSFSNTNEQLIDGVINLTRSLGGVATKCLVTNSCPGSDSKFNSWQVTIKFKKVNPFRLTRKAKILKPSRTNREAIVNICKVESSEARCITVEDNLFITEDYTLTHNSHHMAGIAAWCILRDPTVSIQYITKNEQLGKLQLGEIKRQLAGKVIQTYFPEYLDTSRTRKWSESCIKISHYLASKSRDHTVNQTTIGTLLTGQHPTIQMFDDLVEIQYGNNKNFSADTPSGRASLRQAVKSLSDQMAHGIRIAVGTRYHADDQYARWEKQTIEKEDFNTKGELVVVDKRPAWDVLIEETYKDEDGKRTYLWPSTVVDDEFRGKIKYGYDDEVMAKVKSEHMLDGGNMEQFYLQWFNKLNQSQLQKIKYSMFQYYTADAVGMTTTGWRANGQPLNIYFGLDLASTTNSWSDYTALVVVGIDPNGNVWVLDAVQWKTERLAFTKDKLVEYYNKYPGAFWASVSCAKKEHKTINHLEQLLRLDRCALPIRKSPAEVEKMSRIMGVIEPFYNNLRVWHQEKDETTKLLEDQLTNLKSAHDDLIDALACSLEEICVPASRPISRRRRERSRLEFGLP